MTNNVKETFRTRVDELDLPESVHGDYTSLYLPISDWLKGKCAHDGAFVLGVNGAQGSGKSTFCDLLSHVLNACGVSTVVLSIDDLYHTRRLRLEMGEKIHPLCAIRGVPGTHDVPLGIRLLNALKKPQPDQVITIPRFDKAADDRRPEEAFDVVTSPVDVVLFEGWCVGEPPMPPYDGPYNDRERAQDPEGIWSRWSQSHLNDEYQGLNECLDALLMIKVPSMDVVRDNRWLQEQKLHEKMTEFAGGDQMPGLMSKRETFNYVALFERHTEHLFDTLVHSSDVLILRDNAFKYTLARMP